MMTGWLLWCFSVYLFSLNVCIMSADNDAEVNIDEGAKMW